MINKRRLIEEFCKLVEIDAPSFHEKQMAEYLKEVLMGLGFQVSEDDAGKHYNSECGNIYGYLKGTLPGEPILFSGHMDTVEPAINKKAIIQESGKIVSDGSTVLGADDISGIVAIVEAIRSIQEDGIHHRSIEVLFTIAEEAYLKGSDVFDYSKVKAKEAYVLDLSGSVGTAAYLAPTVIMLEARISGKSAHAGFDPEHGINAIQIAAMSVSKFNLGRIDEKTTANIGIIEGGLATNIVPELCILKGEIRSSDHERATGQAEFMKEILQKTAKEFGGECLVTLTCPAKAYETEKNHDVINRFKKACEDLNIDVKLQETFGGSDNNNFAKHGITGIVLACGMNQVHSCNEYSSVNELINITNITRKLMTCKDDYLNEKINRGC